MPFLLVFLGGGTGAVSRYSLSVFVMSMWNGTFPMGTLVVSNLIGMALVVAGFLLAKTVFAHSVRD